MAITAFALFTFNNVQFLISGDQEGTINVFETNSYSLVQTGRAVQSQNARQVSITSLTTINLAPT